jgi:hypothetical protein
MTGPGESRLMAMATATKRGMHRISPIVDSAMSMVRLMNKYVRDIWRCAGTYAVVAVLYARNGSFSMVSLSSCIHLFLSKWQYFSIGHICYVKKCILPLHPAMTSLSLSGAGTTWFASPILSSV